MIDKEHFCKLVKECNEYHKMVDKLQDALGGIIIEPFYNVTQAIYDYFEDESGFKWDDDLWDMIYDEKASPEEVYVEIMKGIEDNKNGKIED